MHLLCGLHRTLIDPDILRRQLPDAIGSVLASHFPGTVEMWTSAYRKITSDWDSYYADLDLGGADGLADLYEGAYRTTRALFRLTDTPEPPKPHLTQLARTLTGSATVAFNAAYADVRPALQWARDNNHTLHLSSPVLQASMSGMLHGAGLADLITGRVISAETVERAVKDNEFMRRAVGVAVPAPATVIVIDGQSSGVEAARQVGVRTVYLDRTNTDLLGLFRKIASDEPG